MDARPDHMASGDGGHGREPAINLPPLILWLALLLAAIHGLRVLVLDREQDVWVMMVFSFIAERYTPAGAGLPVAAAKWWTPVSYSLLHADWLHLGVNVIWLAAFGSPLARRLGSARTLILGAIASVGGAALHAAFFLGDLVPVVGASAVVSGYMGAAARFAFQPAAGGGLSVHGRALSLSRALSDRRFLSFVGVWLALNFLFGSGALPIAGEGVQIAWQAHVGGFAAGLLAFSLFDRRP